MTKQTTNQFKEREKKITIHNTPTDKFYRCINDEKKKQRKLLNEK